MDAPKNYLLADAEHPLICTDKVWDELLLYNIAPRRAEALFADFFELTDKRLNENYILKHLSGGQKVILMALLALHSPARRICFMNLERSLDPDKAARLQDLIRRSGKEIIWQRVDDHD
jgi:ABC-type multidrug transport system ATPase subunit